MYNIINTVFILAYSICESVGCIIVNAGIKILQIMNYYCDNAVEACEGVACPKISLKIYPFNEFIYVRLINTYSGKVKRDTKGQLLSTKGEHHGIGLENVENVLKNYNGHLQISFQNDLCEVEIMLNGS